MLNSWLVNISSTYTAANVIGYFFVARNEAGKNGAIEDECPCNHEVVEAWTCESNNPTDAEEYPFLNTKKGYYETNPFPTM